MARPKKQNPILNVARGYFSEHNPELRDAPVIVRALEGPPDSPRFAASAETCVATNCPYGVPKSVSEAGDCPIHNCELRHAVRLLLDRQGNVLKETHSGIHWSTSAPRLDDE